MSDERDAYREKAEQAFDGYCVRCGEPTDWSDIEVHHVDRDHDNTNLDNLECICQECHIEEHHDDNPLMGLLVSMPKPVLELVDEAVEEHDYNSRSEAVCRALVDRYDEPDGSYFGGPADSVSSWFADDRHTKWVTDRAVERPTLDDFEDS